MTVEPPETAPAPSARRQATLRDLQAPFDLLVIGGGINGTAVAWDAALRGLRVLLLEKGDWGSGTSSWSSRLIHGGLKYLEKADLPLVRESLRDREWLLRAAPHLVKPLRFVLPFYRHNKHSAAALRLGMLAYDVLSLGKSVPRHRVYGHDETLRLLPGLETEGLTGAAFYYDGQAEYAERLCVEIAIAAHEAGAHVLNYAEVTRLVVQGGRVLGAEFRDRESGQIYTAHARLTINVAGPWLDDVLAGSPAGQQRLTGGTKGSHFVVAPFEGAPTDALYYEAYADGRPMMVIPWLGNYLIGSTDKRFDGDLNTVAADADEVAYVLAETNKVFPRANLTPDDILYSYTGVRPLPYKHSGPESDITRRHRIHDHRPALDGLLSVVGGKLTTFPTLAKHAVDAVCRRLGVKQKQSLRMQKLPGARAADVEGFFEAFVKESGLPEHVSRRLLRIYGVRAAEVGALIGSDRALGVELDPVSGLTAGEVTYTVRSEHAVTLADVLARRTMVGLDPDLGRGVARRVAEVQAEAAGWSAQRVEHELADYERYLLRFMPGRAE